MRKDSNLLEKVLQDTLEGYPENFWSEVILDSVGSQRRLLLRVKAKFKKQEEEATIDTEILGDLLAILGLYKDRTKEVLLGGMIQWLREIIFALPSCTHLRPTASETFLRYRAVEGFLDQASFIEAEWIYPLIQLINVEIKFIKEYAENERTIDLRTSRG